MLGLCLAGHDTAVPIDVIALGMHTVVHVSANMGLAAKRDRLCIRCIVQGLQTHLVFQQMTCWKLQ